MSCRNSKKEKDPGLVVERFDGKNGRCQLYVEVHPRICGMEWLHLHKNMSTHHTITGGAHLFAIAKSGIERFCSCMALNGNLDIISYPSSISVHLVAPAVLLNDPLGQG